MEYHLFIPSFLILGFIGIEQLLILQLTLFIVLDYLEYLHNSQYPSQLFEIDGILSIMVYFFQHVCQILLQSVYIYPVRIGSHFVRN